MKKILIVDDKKEVRTLVSVTLRTGEYQILECDNAEEAVRLTGEHRPDLVILDVMMPGAFDGFEASRRIKAVFRAPHNNSRRDPRNIFVFLVKFCFFFQTTLCDPTNRPGQRSKL